MITVLSGDNDFEIEREVGKLKTAFEGEAERIEGAALHPGDLPDLLLGMTLFAGDRLIIIKNLSDNRTVWSALPEYTAKVPKEISLILVEPKLDKRTKTYKALQKHAVIKEFKVWGEREASTAERWAVGEAKRLGIKLDVKAAQLIARRSQVTSEKGAVIDQWRIATNLEKLAPLGEVGAREVEVYIEETPVENVFTLFETALRGDRSRVKEMVGRLQASEDPFKLFGLLGGQAFWLAVLAVSSRPTAAVAKDFGASPFVLDKLAPYAQKLGVSSARRIASAFAEADASMKTSAASPWVLIERTLVKITETVAAKNSAL